jgi:chromosome segregation ATPase
MKFEYKIYLIPACIAAVVITIFIATHLWSNHKIASLERDVETAKVTAVEKQTAAAQLETQAAEYKAKTEYLEEQIAEINAIATKQNEELEKLSKTTDTARHDVERARNIRSVAATADQLCAKLADLGHPCN